MKSSHRPHTVETIYLRTLHTTGSVHHVQCAAGLYIPGRYHQREEMPTLPGPCSTGSEGTCLRYAASLSGLAEVP